VDWMRLFELALSRDWTPVATAAVGALAVLGGQWLAGSQQARNEDRSTRRRSASAGRSCAVGPAPRCCSTRRAPSSPATVSYSPCRPGTRPRRCAGSPASSKPPWAATCTASGGRSPFLSRPVSGDLSVRVARTTPRPNGSCRNSWRQSSRRSGWGQSGDGLDSARADGHRRGCGHRWWLPRSLGAWPQPKSRRTSVATRTSRRGAGRGGSHA
jgi:hypothetical protein